MPAQAWATLIVGVLAVVGVALTVRQRTVADKRAQAWLHSSVGHMSGSCHCGVLSPSASNACGVPN